MGTGTSFATAFQKNLNNMSEEQTQEYCKNLGITLDKNGNITTSNVNRNNKKNRHYGKRKQSHQAANLEEVIQDLLQYDVFVITGHERPDADCIASQKMLGEILTQMGKTVYLSKTAKAGMPNWCKSIPGRRIINVSQIMSKLKQKKPYVFISVDISDANRLGTAKILRDKASHTVIIDHHEFTPDEIDADLYYIDADMPSCTTLIWDIANVWSDIVITKDIATCAYYGLMCDTNGFRHSNTTEECLRRAYEMSKYGIDLFYISQVLFQTRRIEAFKLEKKMIENLEFFYDNKLAVSSISNKDFMELGCIGDDMKDMPDILSGIEGVLVDITIRQTDKSCSVSLRSKGNVDVEKVASKFGGGGHKVASGVTFATTDIDYVKNKLVKSFSDALA